MNLSNINPNEIYRWFMEMYVESADWVMVPNVYGMGTYADGGIFSTKPYICGSSYMLRMSNYKKEIGVMRLMVFTGDLLKIIGIFLLQIQDWH